ncbi:ser thr protein phosphatase [Diplodia corticola]|uniref:Ser thr protein phosphatase n=1 Tax=Diplodia corticola TaxID=236234 RepID=A0A1J9QN77_9PEZI|nr:ser thr protein phosphatase [Diplodia corticola]OJD30350.1 ser thr protein phosphatase [Diplodia corticola]
MAAQQTPNQPRAFNAPYLPNGGPNVGPTPGNLRSLNELADQARADAIIHTGDFGFYDDRSLDRIAEKTLRHVAQYSPLLSQAVKNSIAQAPPQPPLRERYVREGLKLSELPDFLNGTYSLKVPVYTVWGACEDVQVLEKLRSGEYKISNLHIIDEAHSRLVEAGGIKLRLLGLGGAVVMHKLFDNGEGRTTIAGGQGTMWTTLLQMGELVDTANRVYDPTETRIFVTHASPAREGLLNQLSVTLKADFSISAGLHFRYGSSYNEFSVNPTLDHYRGKLAASRASFNDVWETVKSEVEPAVSENTSQQQLLKLALDIVEKMPTIANGGNPFGGHVGPATGQIDESAFKNMWNFNLADAAYGWLVLDIDQGRIGTEMRAQGFNFAHRGVKNAPQGPPSASNAAPAQAPTGPQQSRPAAGTPAQSQQPKAAPQPTRSPAPAVPNLPIKPATPKPAATPGTAGTPAVGNAEKGTPTETKPNGTSGQDKPAESSAPKPELGNARPPVHGLFITNAGSEDDAKALFAADDKDKIQRIDKGKNPAGGMTAHFDPVEDLHAILNRMDPEYTSGKQGKPYVRVYKPRGGALGSWGSTRGGAQGSGYRSGGASDSEGGRGRGGFRGNRGGRGGERGRGRGRGGYKDGGSGAPAGGDS